MHNLHENSALVGPSDHPASRRARLMRSESIFRTSGLLTILKSSAANAQAAIVPTAYSAVDMPACHLRRAIAASPRAWARRSARDHLSTRSPPTAAAIFPRHTAVGMCRRTRRIHLRIGLLLESSPRPYGGSIGPDQREQDGQF